MKNDSAIETDQVSEVRGAKLVGTVCQPTATKPEQVALTPFKVPTLAIGGEKDQQCLPEDTNKIAELLGGPVDARVPALIIDWLKQR